MSRSYKDFDDSSKRDVKGPRKKKDLRHNAREAYSYFNPERSSITPYGRPGRGASGESSN